MTVVATSSDFHPVFELSMPIRWGDMDADGVSQAVALSGRRDRPHVGGKTGRSSVDTRFELMRADDPDTLYARGAAKIVWVDYAAGKSVPIPGLLRQIIETGAPVSP